VRLK
ncbi:Xanthine phosphoribosyltransferase, partial [Haemophilus influenzae]